MQPKINKVLKQKQTEELPPTNAQEGKAAYQRVTNLKSVPLGVVPMV